MPAPCNAFGAATIRNGDDGTSLLHFGFINFELNKTAAHITTIANGYQSGFAAPSHLCPINAFNLISIDIATPFLEDTQYAIASRYVRSVSMAIVLSVL